MRAAIVHYWLLNRRGGEKVLDALCRLLPDADIFTLFCDPRNAERGGTRVTGLSPRSSIRCSATTGRYCR